MTSLEWMAVQSAVNVLLVAGRAATEERSNDLGRGVGRVSGRGVVNCIFELIDQGFERLIAVVGSLESLVIIL